MDTYFFSKKHFVLSPCELVSIWWCAQLCNSLFLMHSSFKKAQNLWSKVIWLISPILTESLSWRFRVNTWNLRDGFAYIIHWNVDRREKNWGRVRRTFSIPFHVSEGTSFTPKTVNGSHSEKLCESAMPHTERLWPVPVQCLICTKILIW